MISQTYYGPVWAPHNGHVHFWMMGFSALDSGQRAWGGSQVYNFELVEDWGPHSTDPNQQLNFRVVGLPKWYFYVEEYWRRVYIQEWDYNDNNPDVTGHVGKRGIKWDASQSYHTKGPFREGKDNFAMFTQMCRTLPVEYWRNDGKTVRDHYLRRGAGVDPEKAGTFNFTTDIDYATGDRWMIPNSAQCGNFNHQDPTNWCRQYAYGDNYYLGPTLEYQKMVQLDWERLPGFEERDQEDESTGEVFGDGYKVTITLPYRIDGEIQSPFSDANGNVYPAGVYCHVVPDDQKLKYVTNPETNEGGGTYVPTDRDPTEAQSGGAVQFNVPSTSWPVDGKWVEQYLGGLIQAKVKVICEDVFGGRFTNWVHLTQFFMSEEFEGSDQNGPVPE
jgi:hypothetical protein